MIDASTAQRSRLGQRFAFGQGRFERPISVVGSRGRLQACALDGRAGRVDRRWAQGRPAGRSPRGGGKDFFRLLRIGQIGVCVSRCCWCRYLLGRRTPPGVGFCRGGICRPTTGVLLSLAKPAVRLTAVASSRAAPCDNDDPSAYELPFFKRMLLACENGWALCKDVLVGLGNLWFFLLCGLGVWWLVRRRKRSGVVVH